jgi:hypothetical protein
MLPEMVASWAICLGCAIRCLEAPTGRRRLIAAAALLFFGINFVLFLYPPFQLPLVFLGVALIAALWIERGHTDRPFQVRGLMFALAASVVALLVLVPFGRDVWPTLQVVAATEYPGGRVNKGGSYVFWQLLAGPLNFFESEMRVLPGFRNVCEAANFYPLCLLALSGVAVARARTRIRVSPLIVALTLFIVGLGVYCSVELPQWLLRVTLLSHVHEPRALLSLGLANILLIVIVLDRYRQPIFGKLWGFVGAAVSGAALAALFYAVHQRAPGFFGNSRYLAVLIGINALIITFFYWDRARRWLPAAFVALLVCSNGLINPLMSGLRPITESPALAQIEQLRARDPEAKWIAYGDSLAAQFIKAIGASVLTGLKIVPDLPLMRSLSADGNAERVYNRYAWITGVPKVFPDEVKFTLRNWDGFAIELPPGTKLLRDAGYDYYAFGSEWHDASFYDFVEVARPPQSLWVYHRTTASP